MLFLLFLALGSHVFVSSFQASLTSRQCQPSASSPHSTPRSITQRPPSQLSEQQQAASSGADNTILNPLLESIQPSATVQLFSKVKALQAAGQTITSLCVGEPDFGPPPCVIDAVRTALSNGDTRYTAVTGTIDVRTAICHDLERRKPGLVYTPEQIVVANGAKQAVFQALLAVAGVGDVVLVPAPFWPSYPEQVRLCGATPVLLESTAATGYLLDPATLREALQKHPSVKALILCHPSNPTGAVYSEEQLQALAQVLADTNVAVIADEIYERLIYNDDHGSCPSIALAMPDTNVVTINGCSKAYAMTGFRLGYAASHNPTLVTAMTTLQSQLTSCASSIAQAAAAVALVDDDSVDAWLAERTRELQAKRDFVWQALQGMPGVVLPADPPPGAFYVLPNVAAYCTGDSRTDADFCVELLERHQLAIVPGSSFGAPGTVRLSYATSMDELREAMDKLATYLEEERRNQHLELE